jgi:uncharacterized protein YecE (DUF72 family)
MPCWIGTSGWVYAHWRSVFYPVELRESRWLSFYAQQFPTVELNNSFYRLPSEPTFARWAAAVPAGFRFAVKASRYLTHLKKLRDPQEPLERFLGRARLLGDRLGPILYQLPPHWKVNLGRLQAFLACLPSGLTHVIEFRDPSWMCTEVFSLLEERGASLCVTGLPGLSCPVRTTSQVVYVRLHGAQTLHASCYSETELCWWASQIAEALAGGHEVYVYFNNDAFGYAVQNARRLTEMVHHAYVP